jgi:hypothetical protein
MSTTQIGTRKNIIITSHAVGVVLAKTNSVGVVELGRMSYTRRGWKSLRHPLETGERGEGVLQTFSTLMYHEVAKNAAEFSWTMLRRKPILVELGKDDNDPNGTHMKVFYLAQPNGELRKRNLPDGDALLGEVTTVEASELIGETEGKTVAVHVRASKAALSTLAVLPNVHERYQAIIDSYHSPELSTEEMAAIEAYPGKW